MVVGVVEVPVVVEVVVSVLFTGMVRLPFSKPDCAVTAWSSVELLTNIMVAVMGKL